MEETNPTPEVNEPVTITGMNRDIRGQNVNFQVGLAANITADQNLNMERAGAIFARAGEDMQVTYGGARALMAGRDMTIEQGGGQLLIAGNQATVNKGFVFAVVSKQVNLGEGTRVLLNTPQAIVFGITMGVVSAILGPVFKKKRKSKKG